MKRKISKEKIFIFSIIIVMFFVLALSLFKIITYLKNSYDNDKIKVETLKNIITVKNDNSNVEKYDVDFKKLKDQNSDAVAYLKVSGTNIDYVVLRGEDNSYYIKYNFNKKKNYLGWIFADHRNKFDGTDRNIVIYGNEILDGSMFGTLKNVLNKKWQEKEDNMKIVFVTEKNTYYYQVFSTYETEKKDYTKLKFKNRNDFERYIKKLKLRSNHNYEVEVYSDDSILTLSTLNIKGKKVILHAKLIKSV